MLTQKRGASPLYPQSVPAGTAGWGYGLAGVGARERAPVGGGKAAGRLGAAGGWRWRHPAAVRPLRGGVSPLRRSQVLNVGRCCLFAGGLW